MIETFRSEYKFGIAYEYDIQTIYAFNCHV